MLCVSVRFVLDVSVSISARCGFVQYRRYSVPSACLVSVSYTGWLKTELLEESSV